MQIQVDGQNNLGGAVRYFFFVTNPNGGSGSPSISFTDRGSSSTRPFTINFVYSSCDGCSGYTIDPPRPSESEWIDLHVSQVISRQGEYIFRGSVNGVEIFSTVNPSPTTIENAGIWLGKGIANRDPHGKVRNVRFTTHNCPAGQTFDGQNCVNRCANNGWDYNFEKKTCIPYGASVNCLQDRMQVVLSNEHIFENLTDVDDDGSIAWPGTCFATHAATSVNGTYTVDVPLDDCGTLVTQSDGTLTFSGYITGKADKLLVGGLLMRPVLRLPFQCSYDDNYHVFTTNIMTLSPDNVETIENADELASFQITTFTDDEFSKPASKNNPVNIGETVYFQINSTSLPSNVKFVVVNCTVKDHLTETQVDFGIIKDGCLDKIVDVSEMNSDLIGADGDSVQLSFTAFQFASSSNLDKNHLGCDLRLCATDHNGEFVDQACSFNYGGDNCASYTSDDNMGYNLATAVEENP